MRISIWQQWASNHSGSFTVVGKFQTHAAATKAAGDLRHIIATITDWYRRTENADADERRLNAIGEFMGALPLSPPEVEYAQQYGIDWNGRGIDWFTLEDNLKAVHQFGRLVFVENTGDTWSLWMPFDDLLEKMGADVAIEAEPYAPPLTVNLSCLAPDEAIAEQITDLARASLSEPDFQKQMPGVLTSFPPLSDMHIERDGRRVILRHIDAPPIYDSLPRIIEYLVAQGCSDIEYDVLRED